MTGINVKHWMYPINLWKTGFNSWLTLNHSEILQSSPDLSGNEKFWHWGNNVSDISNYNSFYFTNNNNSIIKSIYDNTYGAIKITSLIEGNINSKVAFKDPWMVDTTNSAYYTSPYGYHNLGMSAPYETTDSPLYLTLQSKHKGVLLNQNYNIPGNPYYQISIDSTIIVNGKQHKLYPMWDVTNAQIQYPNKFTTGVVFTNDNAVVTANLKGSLLSNNSNAFAKSGQRKFIRTPNGNLHLVYESMGKVWYEISTDNGYTWQIANGGQPLSGSNESKLPAIDYRGDLVVIVWQEKDGGAYDIKMAEFGSTGIHSWLPTVNIFIDYYLLYNSTNTNPVVSWNGEGRILVMWKRDQDNAGYWPVGIVFSYGALSIFGWNEMDFGLIQNTDSNSINPTLATDKTNSIPSTYHLAWEQTSDSYSYIKYFELYRDGYQKIQTTTTSPETPSSGGGYTKNEKPTITMHNEKPQVN